MQNTQRIKFLAFFLALALVGGAGFAGGVVFSQQALLPVQAAAQTTPAASTAQITVPAAAAKDFQLMVDAWNTIQQSYVDRPTLQNDTALAYGAISGMVEALGDTGHSRFLSPQDVQSEKAATTGQFEGIGAETAVKDGRPIIVAPFEGSPAQKAGVLPGDIILKVDDKDVTGLPLENVISKIKGPSGTQVQLTLQNTATQEIRTLTITRARITINNVTWSMIPGTTIADVRLAGFSQGVSRQLRQALSDAQAQGATSLVLDLRDNPGGLLQEAIGVTSQFLNSGCVLKEKDAQGNIRNVPVQSGGAATNLPMVVLINNGSASAAEVVSSALQDAGRAVLIGQTTFGTGTVLNAFPLKDGSALMLATEEWLTPNGRSIWHQGITPDQSVALPATVLPLTPTGLRSLTAVQVQSSPDVQLKEAIKRLSN